MGSGRLLRSTAALRRRLTRSLLQEFIIKFLPKDSPTRPVLLSVLEQVSKVGLKITADDLMLECLCLWTVSCNTCASGHCQDAFKDQDSDVVKIINQWSVPHSG